MKIRNISQRFGLKNGIHIAAG